MGRDPNNGCDFTKGQKTGSAEAIKNLNLSCHFLKLVCDCLQCSVGT